MGCKQPGKMPNITAMEKASSGFRPGRACRLLVGALVWLALLAGAIWAFGALWFDFPHPWLRKVVATLLLVVVVSVAVWVRPHWRAKIAIALAIFTIMAWWLTLQPRQFRDWKPEVSVAAHAEVLGDFVTFHNVRNFEYRSEKDFTPRYESRRLNLRNLRGVDIFINYWGSPYMAHPILSFDFGPDGRICFSIETRPEKGESYSALGGLYRRFELIYVVADERDVVRVRTNYRTGEDAYLYRLKARDALPAFMEYVHTVNELHRTPRWYNAITNNCTSAIRNQRAATERAPWDWRMLVNGYGDELLYERGAIDNSLPFAELKRMSLVNERAKAADEDADFSRKIRAGLPGMEG
jgi:hypothetical protein